MLQATGIVVSLPALEIASWRLPGSLFTSEHLQGAPISGELRRAIQLIQGMTEDLDAPLIFVARPEMFTHGETLKWLLDHIGDVQDHVCISDGSAVRIIPGLRNHVFFYGLSRAADAAALERLERRTPELFSVLQSQVNTALSFVHGRGKYRPATFVLASHDNSMLSNTEFYRFYFDRRSPYDSVERMLVEGPTSIEQARFDKIIYLPITEASMTDAAFVNFAASFLLKSYVEQTKLVLIRPPIGSDLKSGAQCLMASLQKSDFPFPGVYSANIFLASDDLNVNHFSASASSQIVLHDTYDFWRHPAPYYSYFSALTVLTRCGRHDPTTFSTVIAELCGRIPHVLWPSLRRRQSPEWTFGS